MKRMLSIIAAILLAATIVSVQAQNGSNMGEGKMGTKFYIDDPVGRNNITFTSRAPLEDIIGTTNKISGHVFFDPENPEKGGTGEISVPVVSLNTGIPMRNEHLQSAKWLGAEANPDIKLKIEKTDGVRMVKEGDGFKTYDLNLHGIFTMNGHSKEMTIPGRATYMKESEATKKRMGGNLLAGRAKFSVPLSDFEVEGAKGVTGTKISESIEIEVSFVASDVKPEDQKRGGDSKTKK
jgi:polyisoprenoid-binding protein YceI